MSNLLDLTQINGENPTKFLTTDALNKIQAFYDFTALSIPFDNTATAIVATDVESAIKEAYALAAASSFTNPMVVDLLFANTFKVKAQNGIGELNLRDGANDIVSLLGGTGKLTVTTAYWGISNTGNFTNTDNYLASSSVANAAKWNTTYDVISMRIDGNGLGIKFDKGSDYLGQIWGFYDSTHTPIVEFANNFLTSLTTNATIKPAIGIGAASVSLGIGTYNSVALGGSSYTISDNNTAYVQQLAFADGADRILFTTSITGSATISVPSDNGFLALRGVLTNGKLSYWNTSSNNYEDSLFITDGTLVGIGSVSLGSLFNIANTTEVVGFNVSQGYTLGNNDAAYIQAIGVSGATNVAAKLNATGGSSNYAFLVENGDILGGTTTALSFGDNITPVLANRLMHLGGTNSTIVLDIAQQKVAGNVYGISSAATGATYGNYGIAATANSATNDNVALVATASGPGSVGVRIDGGGLLVGSVAYSSASVIAEFVSTDQAVVVTRVTDPAVDIATPVAGMIAYNTTTNKHQGYDGSAWNDLY